MRKRVVWILVWVLLLTGCTADKALLHWKEQQHRWTAQYTGDGYTLEADIPSVNETIDQENKKKAEQLAGSFAEEVQQRLSEEKEGTGVWVLRGEHTGIHGFADSVALVEYAYLPHNAHGSYQIRTATYRAENGEKLELKSLFSPETDVYRELSRLSRWLIAHTGQLGDYLDEKWIAAGTEPIPNNFEAFLLRPEGLELIFAPYQVGPWALGEQRITIPWLYLAEFLAPKAVEAVGVTEKKGKDMDFAGEG